jgi:hypothetical protein
VAGLANWIFLDALGPIEVEMDMRWVMLYGALDVFMGHGLRFDVVCL